MADLDDSESDEISQRIRRGITAVVTDSDWMMNSSSEKADTVLPRRRAPRCD
jgi:hypothetical protein